MLYLCAHQPEYQYPEGHTRQPGPDTCVIEKGRSPADPTETVGYRPYVSTFAELEAFACFLLTVLLALDHA